jgi:hypothetical protein
MPERLPSARTARAVAAPSAVVVGGAGIVGAVVVGVPLLAILAAALLVWGLVVARRASPRRRRERIDAFTLSATWRKSINQAQSAQRRFKEAVAKADAGPLRERLGDIGARIDTGVLECWRVAQRGDAIERGLKMLNVETTKRALVDVERDLAKGPDERLEQTRTSLRAQLHSAQRMIDAVQDARNQLRLLDARLDEAVTRAVELSLRSSSTAELGGLGSDVDALVQDMEALRAALDDVDTTDSDGGGTA